MAWEEESIESGVDFEEVGGKKSKLKLIMIILAVLVLAAAGYVIYTKFLAGEDKPAGNTEGSGETSTGVEGTQQGQQSQPSQPSQPSQQSQQSPPPASGFKVDLEKFTLNLSGGGAPHYLVCTISLEVTSQDLKDTLLDQDDKQLYMVKTRDAILQILRAKTFEEVKDHAASREIANEIKFKLSRIYAEGDVMNVYFSEFLID